MRSRSAANGVLATGDFGGAWDVAAARAVLGECEAEARCAYAGCLLQGWVAFRKAPPRDVGSIA